MKYASIVIACAAAAIASPAAAKQCPSGQIFRVSKGVCMSKAAAVKAGIVIRHRGKAAHATAGAARETHAAVVRPPTRPEPTPMAAEAAPASETSVVAKSAAPASLGFAARLLETASRAPSPFGGLSFRGLTR